MKNFYRILMLVGCLTLPVQGADSESTLKVLRQIEELASEDVGNGYTDLQAYEEEDFNVGKIVNELEEHFSPETWGKCRFVVVVGRSENIKELKNLEQSKTNRTSNLLKKLNEDGKLRTIIAAHWDGKSGEAVSCDVHLFEIYTHGGSRLVLEYSLTD